MPVPCIPYTCSFSRTNKISSCVLFASCELNSKCLQYTQWLLLDTSALGYISMFMSLETGLFYTLVESAEVKHGHEGHVGSSPIH